MGSSPLERGDGEESSSRSDLGNSTGRVALAGADPGARTHDRDRRERVITALRAAARINGRVAREDLDALGPGRPTSGEVVAIFDSWNAAVAAAGLLVGRSRKAVSRQEMAAAIAAVAGGRRITVAAYDARRQRGTSPSPNLLVIEFGSWAAAQVAAGLDPGPPRRSWTPQEADAALREVAAGAATLTQARYERRRGAGRPSAYAATVALGRTWGQAAAAAGLAPARARRASRAEALDALVAVAGGSSRLTRSRYVASRTPAQPSADAVLAVAGPTWGQAAAAAGLDAGRAGGPLARSREAVRLERALVVQDMRTAARGAARLKQREYAAWRSANPGRHGADPTAAFGSWSAAVAAAGLQAHTRITWSRAAMLSALRQAAAATGAPALSMGKAAASEVDTPSPATVQRAFGTWDAALVAAGLQPGPRRRHRG